MRRMVCEHAAALTGLVGVTRGGEVGPVRLDGLGQRELLWCENNAQLHTRVDGVGRGHEVCACRGGHQWEVVGRREQVHSACERAC